MDAAATLETAQDHMPEDMPPTALEDFFAGLRDAQDDPCVLNTSGSYWRQRGYATGVTERIDRQFGYPKRKREHAQ